MDRCVVCDGAIGTATFANAWEKSRGTFPCCSDACAKAFDPDLHWLPAKAPSPADDAEAGKLIGVARARLARGDSPRVVVREMLQAGVPVGPLRGALIEGRAATTESATRARRTTIVGVVFGALTGRVRVAESTDKRDVAAIDDGAAQLDRWEARYGKMPSSL